MIYNLIKWTVNIGILKTRISYEKFISYVIPYFNLLLTLELIKSNLSQKFCSFVTMDFW